MSSPTLPRGPYPLTLSLPPLTTCLTHNFFPFIAFLLRAVDWVLEKE
jgi:hypothetical protein